MDLAEFLAARLDEDTAFLRSNRKHLWTERPLREVEAKREILALHGFDNTTKHGGTGPDRCLVCITDRDDYEESWVGDLWPCLTLRMLAAVYSDHPDYRQE